jgi:hypothetical protein
MPEETKWQFFFQDEGRIRSGKVIRALVLVNRMATLRSRWRCAAYLVGIKEDFDRVGTGVEKRAGTSSGLTSSAEVVPEHLGIQERFSGIIPKNCQRRTSMPLILQSLHRQRDSG